MLDVQNYEIGGKTGTADQPVLNEENIQMAKINTFSIGISNIKSSICICCNVRYDPKKSKDYYYKYRHRKGGWRGNTL